MRLSQPRVAPIAVDDLDADQREALATVMRDGRKPLNIFATLAHAPKALTRFLQWGDYVLSRRNGLSARDREIVILRVGFLCKSGYEFAQHKVIGLREGLKEHEIEAIKEGAASINWNPAEAALLRASDELVFDHFVSDATWEKLTEHFDAKQCMDVVFTAGQYTQVSMMLNSFGVQLDPGLTLDPDLKAWAVGERLKDKTAVVVGAGQTPGETIGNGRAMAVLFAREGARVLCVDRVLARAEETAAMIAAEGGQASAFEADVGDAAQAASIVETGMARLGRIDILVNNVGIGGSAGGRDGPAQHADEPAFDKILEVNLKGQWLVCKAIIPVMREAGGGAIVNISSLASLSGGAQIAYEVSKAGVNRLTTSVASANAKYKVRCNAVLPGLMDTPMAVGGIARGSGRSTDEVRAARNARVPMGEMGTAWDTANAALFLASDEARFITGVLLVVDGGMHVR